MNTYSPESLGIKPPTEGFQTGGWYSGRQFWGGTLSEPGAIHPGSNQQGSGQAVSQEVVAQTNPANVPYIQQQQQQAQANPVAPTASFNQAGTAGTQSAQGTQPTQGAGVSAMTPQPAINLQELYKGLQESSGIGDLQNQYSEMEKSYIEAKGKINDNPFLSEATRVGRIAKIEQLFSERTANIRGDIATKQADVETQMNLEMKQFDINSQMAQQALSQFNTLLGMGALDNASGEDIASLTRTTGIPSSMIQSAIAESKKSKEKPINTQMITSTAENGEVFAVVMNSDTGEIISKQSLGIIGNVQSGDSQTQHEQTGELKAQFIPALEGVKNSYGHVSPQDWQGAMASWIQRGGDRQDFINNFSQYADPNRGDFDQVYYERG